MFRIIVFGGELLHPSVIPIIICKEHADTAQLQNMFTFRRAIFKDAEDKSCFIEDLQPELKRKKMIIKRMERSTLERLMTAGIVLPL